MGKDKPEYAADWFREAEKPRQPKPEQQGQSADAAAGSSVAEHLGKTAMDALTKLKAQMAQTAAQEEAAAAAKRSGSAARTSSRARAGEKAKRPGRFDTDAGQDDDASGKSDASFAELFDPQEPDEKSFEELLGKSKLDWHAFKE